MVVGPGHRTPLHPLGPPKVKLQGGDELGRAAVLAMAGNRPYLYAAPLFFLGVGVARVAALELLIGVRHGADRQELFSVASQRSPSDAEREPARVEQPAFGWLGCRGLGTARLEGLAGCCHRDAGAVACPDWPLLVEGPRKAHHVLRRRLEHVDVLGPDFSRLLQLVAGGAVFLIPRARPPLLLFFVVFGQPWAVHHPALVAEYIREGLAVEPFPQHAPRDPDVSWLGPVEDIDKILRTRPPLQRPVVHPRLPQVRGVGRNLVDGAALEQLQLPLAGSFRDPVGVHGGAVVLVLVGIRPIIDLSASLGRSPQPLHFGQTPVLCPGIVHDLVIVIVVGNAPVFLVALKVDIGVCVVGLAQLLATLVRAELIRLGVAKAL